MPCSLLRCCVCLLLAGPAIADDWPQFRGLDSTNYSPQDDLPIEWSVEDGKNIAWEADLPGNGLSSPIVVGGRVIVTAASGADNDRLHVLAFNQATGARLWQRQFWATGRTQVYRTSSVAAGTPASDGQRVFALYSSNDLAAFDLEGNLLWIRALAEEHPGLGNDIGMASSPLIVPTESGGAVVVQCESQVAAFAAAFDPQTGATLWDVERPQGSNWTSPVALADRGVVFQSRTGFGLYSASSGDVVWNEDSECDSISSPVVIDGTLLVPSSGLIALTPTDAGAPEVRWNSGKLQPSSASVAVGDGRLFCMARGGILSAADLATGDQLWKRRLGGTCWATPLATPGRVYVFNQEGKAFVVSTEDGKVLAENDMGAEIYGSPAAADGGMFLRSNRKLWKIAAPRQAQRGAALAW